MMRQRDVYKSFLATNSDNFEKWYEACIYTLASNTRKLSLDFHSLSSQTVNFLSFSLLRQASLFSVFLSSFLDGLPFFAIDRWGLWDYVTSTEREKGRRTKGELEPFSFSLGRQVSQSREQQRNPEQVEKAEGLKKGCLRRRLSQFDHS